MMTMGPILLVDDEEDVRLAQGQALELEGFEVAAFARPERVLDRIDAGFAGVIVSDIRMPRMDGMALLEAVGAVDSDIPVILMTGHGDIALAVKAMRNGAYDFLEKPFPAAQLVSSVRRALDYRRLMLENRSIRGELDAQGELDRLLIGRSLAMRELARSIHTVAEADIDVMILGETGTGKALVARAIHELSERRDKPFIAVNIAALPEATLDSELFGHEAGAFPGALRARFGRFEHARGGTLFLDEVGTASPAVQAKLLRAVEERSIERVGSHEPIPLDVRFIASTNRPLDTEASALRDDLLYRLSVATLRIPPLRERLDDLPRLFRHLVDRAAHRLRKETPDIDVVLLTALTDHHWPGNVRELRNVAERFVLGLDLGHEPGDAEGATLAEQVEKFERTVIAATLAGHDGELKATYESLGLSRKTLYEKMQKLGLRREDFVISSER
jgi:two-component system C4-dicarboxylate transport response regulator DctD